MGRGVELMHTTQKTEVNTALATKQATITGAAITVATSDLTPSKVVISNAWGKIATSPVSDVQLGYLSGATSNIQTQLDKAMIGLPVYAGFINGAGTINRDNGYTPFTLSRPSTGVFTVTFSVALSTSQYNVQATPRISTPGFVTYSNQTTTACTFYVFDNTGTPQNYGFSFNITLS